MSGFFAALGFLTVIPVPGRSSDGRDLGASLLWFPVVGLLLGFVVAVFDGLVMAVLEANGLASTRSATYPALAVAALDLALLAVLTGGLHLNGLADTFDGLFHPGGRERRLAIMRDSRSGPHGVAALVLVLLLQTGALAAVPAPERFATLLLAPCLGRWAQVLAIAAFPYARPEGRGTPFHVPGRRWRALLATVLVLVVAAFVCSVGRGVQLSAVLVATLGLGWVAHRQLGGLTGDTYGAICEVSQALALLLYCR